ncbi:zinc metalloprotease [Shimia marina]|uniref:Uncharacterized protein n=1 Tax=Shimia marina TaxID=321267 RepID=A0A0P1F890_9RHOB|nr:hypothetical protein [Shimia marina]CUH50616.1 hypothetical protein SHM7688_00043 [Shimia marina]SFE38815.1 hypothetical protein SAMN04488037_108152 [Shimia marina]
MHNFAALDWPQSLITQRIKTASRVGRLMPQSPAAKLGIQEGWLVLALNGEAPSEDRVSALYAADNVEIVFMDEATEQCFHVVGTGIPFGFNVMPVFSEEYRLDIRVGKIPAMDWLKPWNVGATSGYTDLRRDFEVALSPVSHNLFGAFLSARKKRMAQLSSVDRWSQLGLALAALAQEDFDTALAFGQAYFRNLQSSETDSDPMIVLSAASYVMAACFWHSQDRDAALDMVSDALFYDPDAAPARQLFEGITGHAFVAPAKSLRGHVFPVADYALPQFDPYDVWADPGEDLNLQQALAGMSPKDYGLICVLGVYRSNGPFLEDLQRVLALQKSEELRPAFLHVISAWSGNPDSDISRHRIGFETQMKDQGLTMNIGFDAPDHISTAVAAEALPTWFVIAPGGTVMAYGPLEEGEVITAIAQASNPAQTPAM